MLDEKEDPFEGRAVSNDIFELISPLNLFLEVDVLSLQVMFEPFDLLEGVKKLRLLPTPRQCVGENAAQDLEAWQNLDWPRRGGAIGDTKIPQDGLLRDQRNDRERR